MSIIWIKTYKLYAKVDCLDRDLSILYSIWMETNCLYVKVGSINED